MASNPVAVAQTSDIGSVSSKELLEIQATMDADSLNQLFRFTLKCICDMIIRYSHKRFRIICTHVERLLYLKGIFWKMWKDLDHNTLLIFQKSTLEVIDVD